MKINEFYCVLPISNAPSAAASDAIIRSQIPERHDLRPIKRMGTNAFYCVSSISTDIGRHVHGHNNERADIFRNQFRRRLFSMPHEERYDFIDNKIISLKKV
jgi:hypothetical protein